MDERRLRSELIRAGEEVQAMGLNRGTSGNISVRCGEGMLISASGARIGDLHEDDVVYVDGRGRSVGQHPPSSEWRFHRDIYAARPEFLAIVHTHSVAATTLSCLRMEIPPLHYMIVRAGGRNVRCAAYETFGTQELSDRVVEALAGRRACLIANHGLIAAGGVIEEAVSLAGEVESLAELLVRTLQAGRPVLLTDEELDAANRQFTELSYGYRGPPHSAAPQIARDHGSGFGS